MSPILDSCWINVCMCVLGHSHSQACVCFHENIFFTWVQIPTKTCMCTQVEPQETTNTWLVLGIKIDNSCFFFWQRMQSIHTKLSTQDNPKWKILKAFHPLSEKWALVFSIPLLDVQSTISEEPRSWICCFHPPWAEKRWESYFWI